MKYNYIVQIKWRMYDDSSQWSGGGMENGWFEGQIKGRRVRGRGRRQMKEGMRREEKKDGNPITSTQEYTLKHFSFH